MQGVLREEDDPFIIDKMAIINRFALSYLTIHFRVNILHVPAERKVMTDNYSLRIII